ncbi:hypothetical protein [Pseudonocardia sp.]|uniref:hypothetical protein n=1 Tax=Pseudonocardia sp. TaxID=60912 RepID=UPI00262B0690|nr:hypothetical protein [Pseudonocardia sp.]
MTCYLRLHEVAVAITADPATATDWDAVIRGWQGADGVDGRDAALDAMPVSLIEMDDLPTADLDDYAGLVLSGRSDQQLLGAMAGRIMGLLDRGGVVVFSGQLTHRWLPSATPFERCAPGPAVGPPELTDHPVFAGIEPADLGASFLYRDGYHRPPEGAEVIARRADGVPGAYVARVGPGAVLLHGGANLLANGTSTGSATRIVPQLVEWIAGGPR